MKLRFLLAFFIVISIYGEELSPSLRERSGSSFQITDADIRAADANTRKYKLDVPVSATEALSRGWDDAESKHLRENNDRLPPAARIRNLDLRDRVDRYNDRINSDSSINTFCVNLSSVWYFITFYGNPGIMVVYIILFLFLIFISVSKLFKFLRIRKEVSEKIREKYDLKSYEFDEGK